jgi:serine/threonine protein kinase
MSQKWNTSLNLMYEKDPGIPAFSFIRPTANRANAPSSLSYFCTLTRTGHTMDLASPVDSPHRDVIPNDFTLGDYEALKVVGKGGSSTVYKGILKKSNRTVAIKQIDTEAISNEQILSIKGEIDTIKTLVHDHIVCYLGTLKLSKPSKILIFLEYADRGSLRQFYQRKGALTEPQAANCTRQLLEGLVYLHDNGIAHRDVKCANCLLTKGGVVKLADFGASKRFETDSVISGLKGTPHWMAPEVIKGTQMKSGWLKADVWSVGCTVVEMLTAKLPFCEYDNPMTAMYHIANGEQPPLPEDISSVVSDSIKDFISSCCAVEPEQRPDATDLKSKPFPARHKYGKKTGGRSNSKGGTGSANASPTGGGTMMSRSNGNSTNNNGQQQRSSSQQLLSVSSAAPTLTSTPSEALTELYHNPLTRENSVVVATEQQQQQVPVPMGSGGSGGSGESNSPMVGNGVGLLSTHSSTGTTTKGMPSSSASSSIQNILHANTDSCVHGTGEGGADGAITTITTDDASVSEGSDGGEAADELYLDDFEEGEGEGDASQVVAAAVTGGGGGAPMQQEGEFSFADMIASDEARKAQEGTAPALAQPQEGEFSFADMIAADEASKAHEGSSNNAAPGQQQQLQEGEFSFADMIAADEARHAQEQAGGSGNGRIEYQPPAKKAAPRPDNRPGRRSSSNSSNKLRPDSLVVDREECAPQAPLSATIRAGHGSAMQQQYQQQQQQQQQQQSPHRCGGTSGSRFSEIDEQMAQTQSILATAGFVAPRQQQQQMGMGMDGGNNTLGFVEGEGGGGIQAEFNNSLRASGGSMASVETLNRQQQQQQQYQYQQGYDNSADQHPSLRPSPSAEVYLAQDGATPKQQQQNQQLYNRNSISSVRSSLSTPGSDNRSGNTTPGLVDSELLFRAGSSGAASVRREAMEALNNSTGGGEYDSGGGLPGLMLPMDRPDNPGFLQQQQQRRGNKQRGSRGTGGARSQSANAASNSAVGHGGSSSMIMRLPPMGGLAPLVAPDGVQHHPEMMMMGGSSVGDGVGIAAMGGSGCQMATAALLRAPLGGGGGGGGHSGTQAGVINNPNIPAEYRARPIYSAPSAVSRNPGGLLCDDLLGSGSGAAALPPLQSLTPTTKSKRSHSKLGPANLMHLSR